MGRYIARSDLEALYGASNIAEWADVGANGDATEIDTRVASAIESAESMVEDRLRGNQYRIPFVADDGGTLTTIREICATLAAFNLYKRKGLASADTTGKMSVDWRTAHETLNAIAGGQIKPGLSKVSRAGSALSVVTPAKVADSATRLGVLGVAPDIAAGVAWTGPNAVPISGPAE